ncbi:MAG: four helix bundle protein [Marinoscillum sp.]
MSTIKSFRNLKVWVEARLLNQLVFDKILSNSEIKDFPLKDQINRSSGSVMDNIAEGFGRGGTKEFVVFLGYSLGSLNEVESQLIRTLDRSYIDQEAFDEFSSLTQKLTGMLISFSNYLRNSGYRGAKFKVEEPPEVYGSNPKPKT